MPSTIPNITLNPDTFEFLIKSQGIRMFHSKPTPCPYVRDVKGIDHDPACNFCHNGYLYYGEKEFVGVIMANQNNRKFMASGTWDYDQSQVIIPTIYADGTQMDVQIFDQLTVDQGPIRYYQRVEHSQTGIDRLHFRPISIDNIIDNSGYQYVPGVDFIINSEGRVQWISDKRPGWDVALDSGVIYSIVYYIKPVLTIIDLPHQLRTVQTADPGGNNVQARFPQLAVVRKDYIPFDVADKIGQPDAAEPRNGSTGSTNG
jgi:hypothetical protein